MRAYFTASIVGKKYNLENYNRIIDIFEKNGVSVRSDHIINTSEDKIRIESLKERLNFQKRLERWIIDADCMVVEASFPSISVGYEIALALHRGKPVLVLYNNGEPPSLITNNEEEKLVCESYTPDTLLEIIADFITYVGGANDSRFTFFVTSHINSYLTKMAKKTKVPKSVYLRSLIMEDMKKK